MNWMIQVEMQPEGIRNWMADDRRTTNIDPLSSFVTSEMSPESVECVASQLLFCSLIDLPDEWKIKFKMRPDGTGNQEHLPLAEERITQLLYKKGISPGAYHSSLSERDLA